MSFCGGGWGGVVCKVIFVSNPTFVELLLSWRWVGVWTIFLQVGPIDNIFPNFLTQNFWPYFSVSPPFLNSKAMAWKMTPMERITKSGICPASCAFPQFASPLCFLGHPHCWGPFKFFSLRVFHGDFNFQHNQFLHVLSRSPVFRCASTSILHKINHSQFTHVHLAHFEISLDPMVPYCYV